MKNEVQFEDEKLVNLVDFRESISIKVGRWFLRRGFVLASCIGIAEQTLEEESYIGLLCINSTRRREYLFGFIKGSPRREFFGVIWFNTYHGAAPDNWIFEFYASDNMEKAKRLAEELAAEFGIHITLKLVRESRRFEEFPGDGD